ncbi:MAG: HlyD family efflux transporter periplasmic adaptor subunit [Bacteroidetes bacterium]|nr:MAG: HlyD family efflux transporter periplasmic adaptor subunit [Bacteroidota bacterium]
MINRPFFGKIVYDESKLVKGVRVSEGQALFEVLNYKQIGLLARVLIPESSLSRVSLSNTVRIFLNAFPYTKYQVINGKLIYISPVSENGFVKAKIALEKKGIKVDGILRPLSYGMTLKAKIIVGREPVFYRLLGIKRND